MMRNSNRSNGFSLIEVLVSILIISVGVLGLIAMQARAIQYTQDSAQRNTAAMLAEDLIEMIRSNRGAVLSPNGVVLSSSNYYKPASSAFSSSLVANCRNTTGCSPEELAADQLTHWVRQVRNSLPVDDATLTEGFIICRDSSPASAGCDNSGRAIKIRLAWLSRTTENTAEAETASKREFYQISFEP